MLRRRREPLPVYKYAGPDAWEYLGRYRVQDITVGSQQAAERSKIRGSAVSFQLLLFG
jgi:hypothetical protein